MQGLTPEQVNDLIYLGTFFYEALLRENNLINDRKNTIGGVVPYTAWGNYMLAGLSKLNVDEVAAKIKGIKSATWDLLLLSKVIDPRSIDNEDNINVVRRYLPNAYIRSKATLHGTLVLLRGISAYDPWRDAVIRGMQGDEPDKVDPYLPEVFETSQRLIREKRIQPSVPPSNPLKASFIMNRNQRIVLIVGAVLFLVMLMVPPWHYSSGRSYGYRLLFWPPARSIFIDSTRLVVQCTFVAAATFGSFLLLKSKR
jgi:hypothetical protein